MKRATTLLLAVILATVFIPLPATAQPLTADPAVGRLTNRKAYEPGGEHFLFGHSRGTVHKRKGGIKIRPGGTTLSGNIETETVYFNGTYGYETKFHNHHWDEHSPFEERTLRAGKGKGASLSDGFGATNYVYGTTATKVHPEDGYDGPQGGGYIKPKGARDIYSYSVIGTASRSRMTTPEKAPCIKGAACPASPFFDGLTPGSETHNDYIHPRETLNTEKGTAADAAVRAAHADSADNADIGAIAEGIARQREFQEAHGTTRPYGFTAGQLAAFGKGQSSLMEFTVSVVPLLYSSIGYISFSNIVNELDIDKKLDEIKINWITYTNRIETAEVLRHYVSYKKLPTGVIFWLSESKITANDTEYVEKAIEVRNILAEHDLLKYRV